MVGFEVSPVTDSASIYSLSVPLFRRSRVMLSSQMLCPRLCSNFVAFILLIFQTEFILQVGEYRSTTGSPAGIDCFRSRPRSGLPYLARRISRPRVVTQTSEQRAHGENARWKKSAHFPGWRARD